MRQAAAGQQRGNSAAVSTSHKKQKEPRAATVVHMRVLSDTVVSSFSSSSNRHSSDSSIRSMREDASMVQASMGLWVIFAKACHASFFSELLCEGLSPSGLQSVALRVKSTTRSVVA